MDFITQLFGYMTNRATICSLEKTVSVHLPDLLPSDVCYISQPGLALLEGNLKRTAIILHLSF